MNPKDITDIVTHASQQSDRWLFLAAVVIIILAAGYSLRHMVRQNAAMMNTLTAMMDKSHDCQMKLAVALDRNTTALSDTQIILEQVKERLK